MIEQSTLPVKPALPLDGPPAPPRLAHALAAKLCDIVPNTSARQSQSFTRVQLTREERLRRLEENERIVLAEWELEALSEAARLGD